jgi:hypothetical protein
MMPKKPAPDAAIGGGCRFPAGATPFQPLTVSFDASAGEASSENIMRKHNAKASATSFEVISPWPFLTPETAAP